MMMHRLASVKDTYLVSGLFSSSTKLSRFPDCL